MPNSTGFGASDPVKPMFFIDPGGSADRFQNELYDLTFDTGTGNPTATGVHFISNNQGGMRNIRIRSSDPASTGIGLNLANGLNGPLLVKRRTVEGFHSFTQPSQRIWARQFNAENGAPKIDKAASNPEPMFQVTDASGYFFGVGEYDATGTRNYPTILTETRAGDTRSLLRTDFTKGGRHYGSRIVYLTNAAAGDVPTPFSLWQRVNPGTTEPEDPVSDLDGGGLRDLLEYLFGGNPATADSSLHPRLEHLPEGGFRYWFRLPSQGRSDLRVEVLENAGLDAGGWQPTSIDPVAVKSLETGLTKWRYDIVPAPEGEAGFFRLRVTKLVAGG